MSKKILFVIGSMLCLNFSAKAQSARILYDEQDLKGHVIEITSVFYNNKTSKNGKVETDTTQKKITAFDDLGNMMSIKTYLPFRNETGGKTIKPAYLYKYIRHQDAHGNIIVDAYKNDLPISVAVLDARGHINQVKYLDKKGKVIQHANYQQNSNGQLTTYLLFDEPNKPAKTETWFYAADGNPENIVLVNEKGKKLADKHFKYSDLDATGNWTKRIWHNTLDTENIEFSEERRYTYKQ